MGWFDDNGVPEPQMMGRGGQMKQVQPELRVAQPAPAVPTTGTVNTPAPAGTNMSDRGGMGGSPTVAAPTGGGGSLEAAIAAYQQANPYSPQAYEGLFDHLKQQGFQVERPTRAGGSKLSDDKIVGPDGKMYDLTVGVDGPNPTWAAPQHIPGEYWFNGQRVQRPEEVAGGGWDPSGGANGLSSFGAPGLAAPWTQQFQYPTGTDDPGFQWAMEQGVKGIQNSAAAKGTLLTGGLLKDLANYTTGAALQGYGDTWNRAKNVYDTNRGSFWGNQDNAYNRLAGMANTGANAAGQYATGMGNMALNAGNANAANTAAQNQNWQNSFGELSKLGVDYAKKRLEEERLKKAGQLPPYAPIQSTSNPNAPVSGGRTVMLPNPPGGIA